MMHLEELARREERVARTQSPSAPASAPTALDRQSVAQAAARDALKLGADPLAAHDVFLKTYATAS